MRPRAKPLQNLYFQFIEGTPLQGKVNWQDAARALSDAGYIELLLNKYDGQTLSHYVETEVLRALPKAEFRPIVLNTIADYLNLNPIEVTNGNK